jgi:hypothetical protein
LHGEVICAELKGERMMNWKKESENELRDYGQKQNALSNIPQLLDQIEYELSILNARKTRTESIGGRTYKLDDLLIENIIKKHELERNLLLTKQRVELIEHGLLSIPEDERRILELFYIDRPYDYIQILGEEFGYEKSSLYNKKDRALRRFTLAMYGISNIDYMK